MREKGHYPCPPTDHHSLHLGGREHSGFTVYEVERVQYKRTTERPAIAPRGTGKEAAQNHQTWSRERMKGVWRWRCPDKEASGNYASHKGEWDEPRWPESDLGMLGILVSGHDSLMVVVLQLKRRLPPR